MKKTNEFSFILKSSKNGIGVFAAHTISKGTRLRLFGDNNPVRRLRIEDVPTEFRGLCANKGGYVLAPPDFGYMPIGWYLNHSENPNATHDLTEEKERYGLWIAKRDIKKDEEITIDYNDLEEPENLKEEFYKK